MAVRTDLPQIAALKIAAEKRFGHKIESRSDFTLFGAEILMYIADIFRPYIKSTISLTIVYIHAPASDKWIL